VLEHKGIAGTEGRAGKRGSHLGTAENPTPNGQPQGCDKDAPQGRMARSLTQREDWSRDLGGCAPVRWRATPMPPLRSKGPSPPALPALPVVNDLLTLPLAQRLELVQTLWDSIAAEQNGPDLTDADRQLIDQRLESFLADGDLGLAADSALAALEQSL
jgi:putative addiction module component (TIGR02574 family)